MIDKIMGKYFFVFFISVIFLEIVSFFILKKCCGIEVSDHIIPVLGFTAVIMTLVRKLMLDRAAFVEDYISKFFMDQTLYKAFHDLIYTYDDKKFKQVEGIQAKKQYNTNTNPDISPRN